MKDKKTLEQEVKDLQNKLLNYISKDRVNDLIISKKERDTKYKEAKKNYKNKKKTINKKRIIKNLLITSNVCLLALPVVLGAGLASGLYYGLAYESNNNVDDVNTSTSIVYEYKTIYEDNLGTLMEVENGHHDECICVKLPFEKYDDNNNYYQRVYHIYTDIENEEMRKDILNTDPLVLLSKYKVSSPTYANYKSKENISDVNEYEIGIIDEIKIQSEQLETVQTTENKISSLDIMITVIFGTLGGVFSSFGSVIYRFSSLSDKINSKIYDQNISFYEVNSYKATKEKYKSLKKKRK